MRTFNLQLTRFLQGLVCVPHEQLAEQCTSADLQGHTVRHWPYTYNEALQFPNKHSLYNGYKITIPLKVLIPIIPVHAQSVPTPPFVI